MSLFNVTGADHPLQTYLRAHVPVTLAYRRRGSRALNLTQEYITAVRDQQLSFRQIKQISRNGITCAFLSEKRKAIMLRRFDRAMRRFETRALTGQ